MVHQAPMNAGNREKSGARRVAQGFSRFWQDLVTLGELQARLCVAELGEVLRQARTGMVLLVAGGLLALGSIPVVLAAAALALRAATGMSLAASFAVTAALAVTACAGLVVFGWRALCRGEGLLPRSRREWNRNLQWLKDAARHRTSHERAEPHENGSL